MESLAKATPDEYERIVQIFAIDSIFESEPESEAETEYDDEDNDRPSKRRRNNS
jgi:hypothetical protein